MIRESFGYDESSDFVSWLPIYHDMGLVGNLLQPLYLGSRAILMSPAAFLQKPVRWLQAISDYRARTTGAPNFAFDLAARTITAGQKAALDLSSLDLIYNGSEPIDPRALDRFADAFAPCGLRREALYPCYGMAETTLLATGSRKLAGRAHARRRRRRAQRRPRARRRSGRAGRAHARQLRLPGRGRRIWRSSIRTPARGRPTMRSGRSGCAGRTWRAATGASRI